MSIQLEPISDIAHLDFQRIYEQYTKTFPPEERRNLEQFKDLLSNNNVDINLIHYHNETVGYIITWNLNKGIFIEHFEIFPTHRNQKLGEKVLNHLHQTHPMVVLETEPEDLSEMAGRRIEFYKRNGFHIIDRQHVQPAYEDGKQDLVLYLMSSDEVADVSNIQKELQQTVYDF